MVFPIFDLPREIRDAIYTHTITDHKEVSIPQTDDDTRTYTFDAPLSALLRCSRQVNTEYNELLPEKRRLLVLGADSENWLGYPDINEHLARTIDDCTVFIHNGCLCDNMTPDERADMEASAWQCDGVDFLATYKEALVNFVPQFLHIRKVHLRIGIYGSDEINHDTEDLHGVAPRLGHSSGFAMMLSLLVLAHTKIADIELLRCRSIEAYTAYGIECLHTHREKAVTRSADVYATWKENESWKAGPALKERKS